MSDEPQVILSDTRVVTTRTYRVTNAPQAYKLFARTLRYIPTSLSVTFTGKEWSSARLSGPRLLKSGARSDLSVTDEYSGWNRRELPDWVRPYLVFAADSPGETQE